MIDFTSQMVYRLGNLNTEQQRISYQMSTGRILDRGSDDSSIFARELYVEDKIRAYEGLQTQISKTTAQNNVSDSSISEMKTLIESTKSEILSALNAGMDASDKNAVAVSLRGIKSNLYSLANERVDGEYLFTGSNTTIRPFTEDATTGEVTYNGDAMLRTIAVKPNTYRERGVTGFDALHYNKDVGSNVNGTVDPLLFTQDERIIDQSGIEWHLSEAVAGKSLTFDAGDTIQQRNVTTAVVGALGNTWALSEAKVGNQLTFDQDDVVTDNSNTSWTLNAAKTQLEKDGGSGAGNDVIAVTSMGGDIYKTAAIPAATGIEKLNVGTSLTIREIVGNDMTTTPDSLAVTNVGGNQYRTDDVTTAMESLTTSPLTALPTVTLRHFDSFGALVSADDKNLDVNTGAIDSVTGMTIREYTLNDIDSDESFKAKHSIFDDLDAVINALETATDDTTDTINGPIGLRETLELITNSYDGMNIAHSTLGGRNKIFELAASDVATRLTHFNILSQEIGGADLAKVAMEAKALEMTYTALYSTITKMNSLSLVNFIR